MDGANEDCIAGTEDAATSMNKAHESPRRFTASFSEEVFQALSEMAKESGKSVSDVLRDAIVLEKWISDAKKEGYRVLIEKDDKLRELILR